LATPNAIILWRGRRRRVRSYCAGIRHAKPVPHLMTAHQPALEQAARTCDPYR